MGRRRREILKAFLLLSYSSSSISQTSCCFRIKERRRQQGWWWGRKYKSLYITSSFPPHVFCQRLTHESHDLFKHYSSHATTTMSLFPPTLPVIIVSLKISTIFIPKKLRVGNTTSSSRCYVESEWVAERATVACPWFTLANTFLL